ncbi:MAG: protein kinase [Isosphaeraceae bacterium]|nr:protein kinase [Isosphaeraceae bacterium]
MKTNAARLGFAETSKTSASSVDDPRVVEALEEYLALLKTGRRPSREAFLASRPAIAAELAECLDGLEFVQSAATSLPTSEVPHVPEETLGPATRLGDFRIIREVGRGGMGIVYEAEQLSLGRRVALKVLPFASAIDRRQRQRFRVEAEAAAQLQHPHIVSIYGVGTDRGIHYYAMQFIEGRTVALLINELRRPGSDIASALASSAPDPSTEPTTVYPPPRAIPMHSRASNPGSRDRSFYRTVAELGRQAADALEHAHTLGILHRDIKPANLMVDLNGRLWVTDFGLARIADDGGVTRTGDILGTLRYMSPEQALGRTVVIDERTDVYSLGVTLYELLTLEPAFSAADRHLLLHQVAACEPIPPSRIDRSIPRDLETIVLKAMAKDPIARYPTAAALAADLQRFLEDKPIQARRPHLFEQALKWSRRHRPVVVTALLICMFGLPIATTLIWLEKGQTEKALEEVRRTREREREILRLSFLMSDGMTMSAIDRMAALDAANAYDFYDKALTYYEKLAEQTRDDPSMVSMRAQMLHRIGLTRLMLGSGRAYPAFAESLELFEGLLESEPSDPNLLEQTAALLHDYAVMLDRLDRPSTANRMIETAAERYRAAAAAVPDDPRLLVGLARTRMRWAAFLARERRPKEAEQLRSVVIEEHRKLVSACALPVEARGPFATRFFELTLQSQNIGNRVDTIVYGKLGLEIAPDHSALLNNVAWALVSNARPSNEEAEEALSLVERALGTMPDDWRFLHTRGVALFRLDRIDEAITSLRRSMTLRDGGDPNEWFFMAMAEYRKGNCVEADEWYRKAVDWLGNAGSPIREFAWMRREAEQVLGIPSRRESTRADLDPEIPIDSDAS